MRGLGSRIETIWPLPLSPALVLVVVVVVATAAGERGGDTRRCLRVVFAGFFQAPQADAKREVSSKCIFHTIK